MIAFARSSGSDKLVVALNNGEASNTATIPVGAYFADGAVLTDALGNSSFAPSAMHTAAGGNIIVTLPARTGAMISNFAPTAANVSVTGKVVNAKGSGQSNVRISLTDSSGNIRNAVSNSFGFYRFESVSVGETCIISARSRRCQIEDPTRVLSINEELSDVNFTVLP